MAAVRSVASRIAPACGGSRNCDSSFATSRMGGVSRWRSLGDVVCSVDCRLIRRRDRRSTAARYGFVASCCLSACDCAVLAGVVDDAGGDGAGQYSSGVLRQRELVTRHGDSPPGKRGGSVFG
jgi:hypothetical protein